MTLKTISLVLTVVVLAAVPASATVSIYLSAQGFAQPVPPGSHVAWTLSAFRSAQDTNTEAVDLLITMTVPSVLSNFIGSGDRWNCTTSSTATVCGTSLAAATRFSTPLQVEFDAPTTADGGRFVIPATLATSLPNTHPEISAKIEVNTYRTFAVTTTDDFGAGSLREAIGRANDRCDRTVDCLISFAGPMTIEPRSPLPAVTACDLLIDGGLAQGTSQDIERPVEISGAKANFANGLEIRSWCGVTLRGLTVNGFGANGVVLAVPTPPPPPLGPVSVTVEDCFIGTDTKALEARPNGMRGISIESPLTVAWVRNSTISGNHYSGIAVWASDLLNVSRCRIGLGRDLRPLGNGASGVFVNAGAADISGQIAYNHDFGVAVGRGASHVTTLGTGRPHAYRPRGAYASCTGSYRRRLRPCRERHPHPLRSAGRGTPPGEV